MSSKYISGHNKICTSDIMGFVLEHVFLREVPFDTWGGGFFVIKLSFRLLSLNIKFFFSVFQNKTIYFFRDLYIPAKKRLKQGETDKHPFHI